MTVVSAEVSERWSDQYPELDKDPVPTSSCVSPDIYQQEVSVVFKKVWLKVARVEELPKVGSHKVKRLDFAHTSVLLIRGKDNEIRGFHNVCSHRCNKVVTEAGGDETFGCNRAAVVTCHFHGWVYDAEGKLVSVPQREKFFSELELTENGLEPIRTATWEGFVFINLDSRGTQSLEDYLGDMGNHLAGFPYNKMQNCYAYNAGLRCNWKVALDAFSEAYHVETIHAGTFPNVISDGIQSVQLMGDHRTCAVCLTNSAKPTPTAKLSLTFSGGASVADFRARSMLPVTINPDDRDDFSFELSVVFPNILIHVSEGLWFTHQFWPLSHNRTRWEGRYYLPKADSYASRWAQEFAVNLQRNAWLEDTATMEATQEGMESGVKGFMHLQDEEILVRHGYHVMKKYLKSI